jgi:hypothetical protein
LILFRGGGTYSSGIGAYSRVGTGTYSGIGTYSGGGKTSTIVIKY